MSEGLIFFIRFYNICVNVEFWIEILCGWIFCGLYGFVFMIENVVL